ncbi:MAG: c-type cytochrome domain-containing protein, partial [Planctomycetota bacterium]|nr:c-type cytochrome domain-containing protein [Planctomycetota bacterium]
MARFSFIFLLAAGTALSAAEPFEAFLTKHCISCHGPKKEKGDLRIDKLSRDFKAGIDGHLWAEVVEQINAGEMPPKKEPQPTENEIAFVI